MKWELRKISDKSLVETKYIEQDPWQPSEQIVNKYAADGLKFYRVINLPQPANTATQKPEQKITISAANGTVTYGWKMVNYTTAEKKALTFQNGVNTGFPVYASNDETILYYLGLQIEDINNFDSMLALINEAKDIGLMQPDTPVSFLDKNGIQRNMTMGEFKILMVKYGFYYKTLFDSTR